MHAYDWRTAPARAARDGVAVLAIVAPPARLQAALAKARETVAADKIVVVGLKSGEEAAAVERVA